MPRFAANLSMMVTEVPFLDRFAAAADAGFDAVEFLFPYEHKPEDIAARLKQHKLEQALFNCPPGNWEGGERGLAVFPARRAEFEASIDTALAYAEATGVKRLHLMAGIARHDDATAKAAYESAILFACDKAQPAGLDIVIEPINPRDVPGYFLNNFDVAAEIVKRFNRPNLKLQFDIYHRQIIHGDVIRGLEAMMPIIGHIQTASVPGRNEPGTGELDDARVFATLDRLGYKGFVGCEYRPAGETKAGLAWFTRARA
jgi:hydroxypyruvate isomerase